MLFIALAVGAMETFVCQVSLTSSASFTACILWLCIESLVPTSQPVFSGCVSNLQCCLHVFSGRVSNLWCHLHLFSGGVSSL